MKECKHERVVAYTEDGARYHACRDCGEVFPQPGPTNEPPPVGQPTPQTGESTTQPPCKGCGRPFDRHWQGTEGVFCNSADYPDEHKLFGAIVSDKKYIPAESTGVEGDRSDPWKAVDRIKRKHEAVVSAAQAVVNCATWQGEQAEQFLAEAITELKAALGRLAYTQPSKVDHD